MHRADVFMETQSSLRSDSTSFALWCTGLPVHHIGSDLKRRRHRAAHRFRGPSSRFRLGSRRWFRQMYWSTVQGGAVNYREGDRVAGE